MTNGNDVQQRLDALEDGLRVEYPTPETPGGGAQRLRLEVPTPWSLMTIGARGTGASDGRAVGPGGFALMTTESLGAEIQGSTCIDTDGLTIVHSIGAARALTQADLGIASSAAMRLGTTEGHIELTAGEVPVNDPAFKVIPSMPVPAAPAVDTSAPRAPSESARGGASFIWGALDVASGVRTWWEFLSSMSRSSGVAAGTLLARVSTVINLYRTAVSIKEAAVGAWSAAASAYDLSGVDDVASEAPEVKLHGAGGVSMTSPASVSAFAPKLSFTAQQTASFKAVQKVSVQSMGYGPFYGGALVSVSSEGPAGLKSTNSAATISGKFAEVSAKDVAVVRSTKYAGMHAETALALESPSVAVAGDHVGVSGTEAVEIEAPSVKTSARTQNTVHSRQRVLVQAGQTLRMEAGPARIEVVDGEISLYPGGGQASFVVDRTYVSTFGFRVERNRTRIRGNVDLG